MRAEVLKGHLDLLLLAAVEREPAHGYGIIESLRGSSGGHFDLAEGTVYPALYRLERAGFLTSSWETRSARRRRVYRLTRKGKRRLASERRAWSQFAHAVDQVAQPV